MKTVVLFEQLFAEGHVSEENKAHAKQEAAKRRHLSIYYRKPYDSNSLIDNNVEEHEGEKEKIEGEREGGREGGRKV